MNTIQLCALLFSFLLTFAFADNPPAQNERIPMDCYPANCGKIKNITYPFWVDGQQQNYCGFPSLKLNCIQGFPILDLASETYQVKKILYKNQSVLLTNTKFLNKRFCPVQYSNLSFGSLPFSVSSDNREIVFLFDCSESMTNYYEVPCASNVGNGTFVSLDEQLGFSGSSCQKAILPVWDYSGGNAGDILGHLGDGFLMNWNLSSCLECKESNGQCGYNYLNYSFMCICADRTHLHSCHEGKSHKMYIAIGASVSAAFLIAFCVILLWHIRRKKHQKPGLSNLLSRSFSSNTSFERAAELGESNYHTHIFSYDELDAATDGFNASRELGDGGFGTVYKGKLRDGRTVAVKRLYEHNYRRLEQFMNEVEILSCLRHQYLVTLYGCTSRHSRELLLVYEYIPNGTVADHLHGPLASKGALPWSTRLSIAIETADALAYLHNVEPQVIHRDVKSNNILLDNNFHVKVADFGLSRLFPLDATHVSTAPQGTPGYVDPEYHQCYQLTDKSDVYSFGVVLVELISSKPAVDINRHRHEINLANMAVTKIQNCQVEELVDLDIGYMEDVDIKRMINQVAELAFRCLQLDREMRPCMTEVLEGLRGIEGKEAVEVVVVNEVKTKEEGRLLKSDLPCSPDSVTERWQSISTTPSASA